MYHCYYVSSTFWVTGAFKDFVCYFYIFPPRKVLNNYGKCFLFHQKHLFSYKVNLICVIFKVLRGFSKWSNYDVMKWLA